MANNLSKYLDGTVRELAAPLLIDLSAGQKERHRIFANLLFAIAAHFFNARKYGPSWDYPLAPDLDTDWSGGSYLGHNIAAIAVDRHGHVIDFAFNHNEFFQSSVEHAESRLLRRVFSLSEVYDSWALHDPKQGRRNYSNLLSDVTVYTTLESCTQCSGIMTLAGVKEIVYLQDDPQMYRIGNIVRRLSEVPAGTPPYLQAPLPIPGCDIGLDGYKLLNEGFVAYKEHQKNKVLPFIVNKKNPSDKRYKPTSITSYLCTGPAYKVFAAGAVALRDMGGDGCLEHPKYSGGEDVMTNSKCLKEATGFLAYVQSRKDRASAHKA